MDFENRRKLSLSCDRSNKGSVDTGIKELVETINNFQNIFTTSSCAGRVAVIKKINAKKTDSELLFCSHSKLADEKPIIDSLSPEKNEGNVWILFQPSILHICCKTIDDATWLFARARKAGYKRTGIISVKENVMVEIIGTDFIEHLLYDLEGIYYTRDSLKALTSHLNNKFDMNLKKISAFNRSLRE